MQESCQWQEIEEIPPPTLARTFFLCSSPADCQTFWLIAGIWGYFQVLDICRVSPHEKWFKVQKQVLNNSICLSVLQWTLPNIFHHDLFHHSPKGKERLIHLDIFVTFATFTSPFFKHYLHKLSFPVNCWHSTHNAINLIFSRQYKCLHDKIKKAKENERYFKTKII